MALAEFVLELNKTGFPRLFGFTTSEIRVEADNFTPFDSNKNNSVIIAVKITSDIRFICGDV